MSDLSAWMLLDVKLEAESSVVPEAQTDPAPPGPASDAGAPASCAAPVPLNASQCDACFQKSIDQRKLLTHDVNHFKKRLQSLEAFQGVPDVPVSTDTCSTAARG